jgi:hypothetical protein
MYLPQPAADRTLQQILKSRECEKNDARCCEFRNISEMASGVHELIRQKDYFCTCSPGNATIINVEISVPKLTIS